MRLHTGRQAVRRAPRPARQPACDSPRGAGGTEVRQFPVVNWVGYNEYRDERPKSALDEVQYAAWTAGDDADAAQIAWDNELVPELRELVEPGDNEFFEVAFQSAFIGTPLPLELNRKRIEVNVITGTHLDWCVEGNARAARDFGYVPIVIGDATGAETVEQEQAAFERINRYFAPVITSRQFVDFLGSGGA